MEISKLENEGASHTGSRSTAGEKKLANREALRGSEGNGEIQKKVEGDFDEKRV
ncbi:hypothetical protein [Capnocytophaga ochracea]|uniref:hypothetical protein n=1 Tax=Capnocytophaga ochracea TaxID=1018 RepID=UPI00026F1E70|nr:hypothetical protein [Capnocytophaga ochracea]EJF45541.1 hypothetical protein HMPREF1319_0702 [Capnocytophaga ochracea str. Holt 25]UEB42638.1 hypothetical protein LK419_07435 [Capnocytophaga ochracea]